ncbi:methyltransferase [Amycolatopsis ultiminotia]|uniref:methyltransferase n=1 Tax=Amycolatopsis ultiminotia TaxID=543629 RepID=UPI0031F15799
MVDSEHPSESSPSEVMAQLLDGFALSQALFVLAEAGVATVLEREGPQTVAALAERTQSDPGALGRLIRSLAPHGVFRTDGDRVAVTALGATLSEHHPQSVHSVAVGSMDLHYRAFAELRHTLRTGEPAATRYFGEPYFDWIATDPARAKLFGEAMTAFGTMRAGMFDGYRLPPGRTIADLGASDGSLLVDLLLRDHQLDRRGIVFDLPTTVESARPVLAAAGVADRVDLVAGDFFEAVPSADIYLLSWILHDWSDADSRRILTSIASAAPPHARLLVVEQIVPAGDDPHPTKKFDLTMLGILGGKERSEQEYRELLDSGGFAVDRVVPTSGPFVIIEATRRDAASDRP